jgi:hypothetical protein
MNLCHSSVWHSGKFSRIWDFRFSRRRVWRRLFSGLLAPCSLVDVWCLLPPSSGRPPWLQTTRLHGATAQKTVIFSRFVPPKTVEHKVSIMIALFKSLTWLLMPWYNVFRKHSTITHLSTIPCCYRTKSFIINSMEHSPSWEVCSRSAGQKIAHLYRTRNFIAMERLTLNKNRGVRKILETNTLLLLLLLLLKY